MINQELLDYIKGQLAHGAEKEEIKKALVGNGWLPEDVEQGFREINIRSQPLQDSVRSLHPDSPGGREKKFTLLASLIVLLLLGGGVFAYFKYSEPKLTPEQVVSKMTANLTEIKSLGYSGEIKVEAEVEDFSVTGSNTENPSASVLETKTVLISLSGRSDIQSKSNPAGEFSLSIRTDALPEEFSLEEISFGLEIRIIDSALYLKITDTPDIDFFDLSILENKWVKLDQTNLVNLPGELEDQTFSEEEIEKLKIAAEQAKIFQIIETLEDEAIDGADTYHYRFVFNRAGVRQFLIDTGNILEDPLSEEELSAFDAQFDSLDEKGEIWIGKNDFLPRKISLQGSVQDEAAETLGKFNINILFEDFNQPFQVAIPEPTVTAEELLKELFSPEFPMPALP